MSRSEAWFAAGAGGAARHARAALFCLPHAGGGASAFRGWAEALAPDVEAVPIQLPGRERRLAEPVRIEPAVIAAAVRTALKARGTPRYAFYGHSLGGWLAFEIVRQLGALGEPLPARLYVGAARPPDAGLPPGLRGLSDAPQEVIAQRLVRLGGIQREVFDYPELADLVLGIIRADFAWLESYTFEPQPPLAVPIVAFSATGDEFGSDADMAGWARHTSAGLTRRQVTGSHLFAQERRDELTAFIRADLGS